MAGITDGDQIAKVMKQSKVVRGSDYMVDTFGKGWRAVMEWRLAKGVLLFDLRSYLSELVGAS